MGSGYLPVAPGTAGSILAVCLFYFLESMGRTVLWMVLAFLVPLSLWGASAGRREWGKDPSRVNIDEVLGCWIACLGVCEEWGITGLLIAFIVFRILDIIKPWPVIYFDRIDSAAGIVLDDAAAGLITMLILLIAGVFL